MDIDRKRPIEFSLAAARKRKSPQTGMVHFCYESKEDLHDTIPLLENFCYALSLLRSRLVDNIQEAKGLLERLLCFEVEGNFPIYLHEYPRCRKRTTGIDLIPIFHWILADFSSVLGEVGVLVREVLERVVRRGEQFHAEKPLPAVSHFKWRSYTDPEGAVAIVPRSAEELAEILIAYQMAKSRGVERREWLEEVLKHWHVGLCAPFFLQAQEGFEPKCTLLDLFMAQYFGIESKRVLRAERVHLLGGLVQPFEEAVVGGEAQAVPATSPPHLHFWRGPDQLHTLCFDPKKAEWEEGVLTLPLEVPPEGEESIESAFYLNFHSDHEILIEGKKGTTFRLGEKIQILSQGHLFTLTVEVEKGEGRFFGHLLRANRPQQKKMVGFEAYDWQIALRTLSRTKECALRWTVHVAAVEVSAGAF